MRVSAPTLTTGLLHKPDPEWDSGDSILFTMSQLKPSILHANNIWALKYQQFFFPSTPFMLISDPPSNPLFWRKGFLLSRLSIMEYWLRFPFWRLRLYLIHQDTLSEELLPAHLQGLPEVTQNLPILLLQLDPWTCPIPRTLQPSYLVECLGSAGPPLPDPPTSFCGSLVLLCWQMGHGSNSSAGLHGSTYTYQIRAQPPENDIGAMLTASEEKIRVIWSWPHCKVKKKSKGINQSQSKNRLVSFKYAKRYSILTKKEIT